ncbi:MAG: HAD family hydrolase [Pseudorhodobacter sp.]
MTPTFDAVIFDLDGTLLDTERCTGDAGIRAFAAFGIDLEPDFLHRLIGKDDVTGSAILHDHFPRLDLPALRHRWDREIDIAYENGIPLKPGARELLDRLDRPKALATSSTRGQARRKLDLTGLAADFSHVVTFDDVASPKPAPDAFLLAARHLGCAPAACIAFEDSEPGAESAFRAGMTVVQVPDILPASGQFAHLVADNLIDGARRIGLLA